jgi:hypothetical protein
MSSSFKPEIINQIEAVISAGEFYNGGLMPAFSVRDYEYVKPAYSKIKNAPVHSSEPFAMSGYRSYAFFKSSNDNSYVVEIHKGELGRVFKVGDLF